MSNTDPTSRTTDPTSRTTSMPIRLIDKWSVGETPTGATETVALPGTQKLSVNRIGMEN